MPRLSPMIRLLTLLPTIARSRMRLPNSPRLLTFIVTFRCNARCIMCDSWKKQAQDELSLAEIQSIFRQLPKMDFIRLSGGEPFLRKDILDIANAALQTLKPLALHITTNGFLPEQIVRFCEKRPQGAPLYLLISLDGMRAKHNAVRGRQWAWDRAVQTIEALAPRQRELHLKLMVNQTIVDAEGVDEYRKLRSYLKAFGIRNNLVMAYEESATYHQDSSVSVEPQMAGEFIPYADLSARQLKELFVAVAEDLNDSPLTLRLVKRYYLKGIQNRLLKKGARPNPPCVALGSHLRLMPDGSIPTCQFNTLTIGNLRRERFEDIWCGESAARQRRWVANCPGCWAECEVLPNALYSGDLLLHTFCGLLRRSPHNSGAQQGVEARECKKLQGAVNR